MLARSDVLIDGIADAEPSRGKTRVSDEDFLRTVRRDLAAVYTDVLREPIPDRIASVLTSIEAAFQPSSPTYA
jgi:hypothetical protein